MTFRHATGSGSAVKGHCKDCARSRTDEAGNRFCQIKETFTHKLAPVSDKFTCICFKPIDRTEIM